MKLYTYFRSSSSYRVRIALNLKGLPYQPAIINIAQGAHNDPDFLAVNPHGRVPALETEHGVLIQSPAILEYLEEAYPEPALLPKDLLMRAKIRAVCALIGCDIHPLNNLCTLNYLKGPLAQDQATVDTWYRHWVIQGFDTIEELIGPGPFTFGATPTLADVYLVPQIFNARRFNVSLDPYPKIAAAEAACGEIEAFQAAAPARQPDGA